MEQTMMNNMSRQLFKKFLTNNPALIRVDSRNVFDDAFGNRYAFCISSSKKSIECRQFYSDCTDLVAVNPETNTLCHVAKRDLAIDASPNRITTGGIKAFTAKAKLNATSPVTFVL
jgi:hypothetical protein